MINRAVLVGRLTRDSELRYTQSGTAVTSFNIAVNRTFTNSNSEREADFINCIVWRKAAENFNNFTHKGSLVGIDGRIQSRSYENKQGQRVYVTEVVVDKFSLLEPKGENQQQVSNTQPKSTSNNNDFDNKPEEKTQQNSDYMNSPFIDNSKPIDISDDDLPF